MYHTLYNTSVKDFLDTNDDLTKEKYISIMDKVRAAVGIFLF